MLANETKQLNQAKLDKLVKKTGQFHSIGRRKDALARVYIQTGNGEFFVNKREINKYFTLPSFAKTALMPLELVKFKTKMNVKVFVKGGGISGQAGAVKLGLSRALSKFNPEWRVKFRSEGLNFERARDKPSFTAPACPDIPPPLTNTFTFIFVLNLTNSKGMRAVLAKLGRVKYLLISLLFTKNSPLPV